MSGNQNSPAVKMGQHPFLLTTHHRHGMRLGSHQSSDPCQLPKCASHLSPGPGGRAHGGCLDHCTTLDKSLSSLGLSFPMGQVQILIWTL